MRALEASRRNLNTQFSVANTYLFGVRGNFIQRFPYYLYREMTGALGLQRLTTLQTSDRSPFRTVECPLSKRRILCKTLVVANF